MRPSADDGFAEDDRGITYREPPAPAAGMISAGFGVLFFACSIAFMTEIARWPWHGGKVMGIVTALVFLCFGSAAMLLARAGFRPQHLRFERDTRRVHGRLRGRLWLPMSVDVSFLTLQRPFVQANSRESEGDLYEVQVPRTGHRPLALGAFEEEARARHWQERLTVLIASPQ